MSQPSTDHRSKTCSSCENRSTARTRHPRAAHLPLRCQRRLEQRDVAFVARGAKALDRRLHRRRLRGHRGQPGSSIPDLHGHRQPSPNRLGVWLLNRGNQRLVGRPVLAAQLIQYLEHHVGLGLEVQVEGRPGGARSPGDVVDRGRDVSARRRSTPPLPAPGVRGSTRAEADACQMARSDAAPGSSLTTPVRPVVTGMMVMPVARSGRVTSHVRSTRSCAPATRRAHSDRSRAGCRSPSGHQTVAPNATGGRC